jgi:hypothetical protein
LIYESVWSSVLVEGVSNLKVHCSLVGETGLDSAYFNNNLRGFDKTNPLKNSCRDEKSLYRFHGCGCY